ncbi:MAG: hypothetical protein ABSC46_07245 [Candidatus Limnocylindrales bacterium]|jgi:hypothetical protein
MARRPGFFGGSRRDAQENDAQPVESRNQMDGAASVGFADPNGGGGDRSKTPSAFDPVWGTLGAPAAPSEDWFVRSEEPEGPCADVEIFGNGFRISGRIRTRQFDRLSGWINMQTGFIAVRDAVLVRPGQANPADLEGHRGALWIRVDQIVLMAERSAVRPDRRGAPVVQKRRRQVSIVTPGYELRGCIHVHEYGSMLQFLESPDAHFLPLTDLTVRWPSDASLLVRYKFAMVNREQIVTVIDETSSVAAE